MEWIKKYLLEGKFTSLCIPYTQPTQLLFSVLANELELNWHNYALTFKDKLWQPLKARPLKRFAPMLHGTKS